VRKGTDGDRDAWLSEVTKEHLGPELGSSYRGVIFKQVVAGEDAVDASRSVSRRTCGVVISSEFFCRLIRV
jgi:hypothetical protein